MKKDQKLQKTPLRISIETLRTLSLSQLTEVAGGSFNNGCPASGGGATICLKCQF